LCRQVVAVAQLQSHQKGKKCKNIKTLVIDSDEKIGEIDENLDEDFDENRRFKENHQKILMNVVHSLYRGVNCKSEYKTYKFITINNTIGLRLPNNRYNN